jgi:hypothetical protein
MAKMTITSKCTCVVAHFEDLADAPVLCGVQCPMQHIQGYTRSLWTLPLDDYLLCIALAAARATANKTMMKKCTNFAGHFDGTGGVLVQYRMHHPMEEVQDFTRSHWTPPLGEYCDQ